MRASEILTENKENRCMQCGMKNCKCPGDSCKCKPIAGWVPGKGFKKAMDEAANAAQQAAIAISMKKAHKKPKNESTELEEEFDLIESIIDRLAEHNGVDVDVIWADLETLTEDELYAFAVTSEPIMENQGVAEGGAKDRQWSNKDMERLRVATRDFDDIMASDGPEATKQNLIKKRIQTKPMAGPKGVLPEQGVAESEAWQKANNRDRTDGMSRKAVNTYRREHPGSKLQTAVTTKPSKLKKGSKASKRRKSYCSRSRGQMKMHSISCAKTPDKAICKARRRWNC